LIVLYQEFNNKKKSGKRSSMTCYECPVCMETVPEEKMVQCCNGHRVCEKHQLQRIRAIYQEGRSAFNQIEGCENGKGQHCFVCRCVMSDSLFSVNYFKMLRLIQAIEIPKLYCGKDLFNTNEEYRAKFQSGTYCPPQDL